MDQKIIITDENGIPAGVMDPEQLQNEGAELAFQLAEHCGDEPHTQALIHQMYQQYGPQGIRYVLIAAVRVLNDGILASIIDGLEKQGVTSDTRATIASSKAQVLGQEHNTNDQ